MISTPDWSPRRLNRLASALNVRTYLEIGVAQGLTFLQVDTPVRTAVDPRFTFDTSPYANDHTHFAQMTSDAFFCYLPTDVKFDLVFVDGLHTFDQAYRDLCSVLAHTHDRSAILIDDTVPNDVYSAIPDAERAYKFRKAAGNELDESWHGDVFKVVYAIHDYHLALDYRTIVGAGNPQTLVWRSSVCRTPMSRSMEDLTRLSYFDLLDSQNVLMTADEDGAIETCIGGITSVSRESDKP